jgi:Flp pilus assembly pilin Flp
VLLFHPNEEQANAWRGKNKNFITSRQGTAAVEYGLLSALIVLTILTTITLAESNLNGVFIPAL